VVRTLCACIKKIRCTYRKYRLFLLDARETTNTNLILRDARIARARPDGRDSRYRCSLMRCRCWWLFARPGLSSWVTRELAAPRTLITRRASCSDGRIREAAGHQTPFLLMLLPRHMHNSDAQMGFLHREWKRNPVWHARGSRERVASLCCRLRRLRSSNSGDSLHPCVYSFSLVIVIIGNKSKIAFYAELLA